MTSKLWGKPELEIFESSQFQHTLSAPVSFCGTALHSGQPSSFSIMPAPVHYGIRFGGGPPDTETPKPEFVYSDDYMTSVHTPDLRIQCIEHLMSSLHGLGITNAHVRCLAGDEFPILDGSAEEIARALLSAGLERQSAACRMLRICGQFALSDESGRRTIACSPAPGLSVQADIDFPSPIGRQSYSLACTSDSYVAEIAGARTFLKDSVDDVSLSALRRDRLKGLSDPCQLIHYNRREFLCALKFEDEPVRHKILDFLGDVYTLGMPVCGHFHLVRPGHALTRTFVELLELCLRGRAPGPAGRVERRRAAAPAGI